MPQHLLQIASRPARVSSGQRSRAATAGLRKFCYGLPAALAAIALFTSPAVDAAIPASERQVLVDFYNASNGDGWTVNANWCSGACPASGTPTFNAAGTECTWYGVACDAAQAHVVAVALPHDNLAGTLPALSGLTQLQYFSVVSNRLGGALPALGALTSLQTFYAADNAFTGAIPSLAGLARLGDFSVRHNQLSGSLPALTGLTALYAFDAADNRLTGSVPAIAGLSSLRTFDVGGNQLSGSLPAQSGLTTLLRFAADRNFLAGTLPAPSPNLYTLNVGHNLLTGAVPAAPATLYTPLAFAPSTLCPNPLSTAASANDAGWNAATGYPSWYATPFASNRCDDLAQSSFE